MCREDGGEEGESGEEGRAKIQVVEKVEKVLGVDSVRALFQLAGPYRFHTPQHEDVGIGQVATRRIHLLQHDSKCLRNLLCNAQ